MVKDVNTFLGNMFKKYGNMQTNGWQTNGFPKNGHQQPNKTPVKRTCLLKPQTQEEILSQRQGLPVFQVKQQLITALKEHDTVILIGETASGKTTQIPQFIFENDLHRNECIAVTQPRRVAATSVASRVATEMCIEIGQEVGYCVRFDERTSSATRIKFLTDGMLLREAISDHLLGNYSFVILDEAHERSVQTDVLFGIVKRAQALRLENQSKSRLKILVMSATMDVDNFSKYFSDSPVFYLEGRTFPIEKFYCTTREEDYVESALVTVLQIHRTHREDGDILVFCSGVEEINGMVSSTRSASQQMPDGLMKLLPLPLHASLPPTEQERVFLPSIPGVSRKVIYSTNVAETSLTISGIRFVVDTCRVKVRNFNAKTGFETLTVDKISKAQAEQRAGRAGREGPGVCYRLLTDNEFAVLPDFSVPEILRVNLSNVTLQLIAIGITNILTFDFLDKPKFTAKKAAIEELLSLSAIVIEGEDEQAQLKLTPFGQEMVSFPLDPKLSRILVSSKKFGCTDDIITILSMLYVDNVFFIPENKREYAVDVLKKYSNSEGDHMRLLKVYRAWVASKGNHEWMKENFINIKNMQIVSDVRKQLIHVWDRTGHKRSSCGNNTEQIRRCLLRGLFSQVAVLTREGSYRTRESNQEVFIHPSSCLFGSKPEALIYSELVHTTKNYMRNVSLISIDWIDKK